MSEQQLYPFLLYSWMGLAVLVFVLLFWVNAPYGRHVRAGWGPTVSARLGWLIMETPAVVLPVLFFLLGQRHDNPVAIVLLALWLAHYIHRAFVFPILLRAAGRAMPLVIVLMAISFNLGNAYFNGRWLFSFGPAYELSWLYDVRFISGALCFMVGKAINLHSDHVLRKLRQPGEHGYAIPTGGLYRWVSCPNYLGEIIQWCGWALATWSLAGLSFALWSIANLAPRAYAHHRWYHERFETYPRTRRALVPLLW